MFSRHSHRPFELAYLIFQKLLYFSSRFLKRISVIFTFVFFTTRHFRERMILNRNSKPFSFDGGRIEINIQYILHEVYYENNVYFDNYNGNGEKKIMEKNEKCITFEFIAGVFFYKILIRSWQKYDFFISQTISLISSMVFLLSDSRYSVVGKGQARTGPPGSRERPFGPPLTICIGSTRSVPRKVLANKWWAKKITLKIFLESIWVPIYRLPAIKNVLVRAWKRAPFNVRSWGNTGYSPSGMSY